MRENADEYKQTAPLRRAPKGKSGAESESPRAQHGAVPVCPAPDQPEDHAGTATPKLADIKIVRD